MTERNLTCEERIQDDLTTTESWLNKSYGLIDAANEAGDYSREDDLREEIEPYKHVMTLELSGGGPSSWLEVELEKGQRGFQVASVIYHFADWFDHAERAVIETQAPGVWRLAEYYVEHAEWLILANTKEVI